MSDSPWKSFFSWSQNDQFGFVLHEEDVQHVKNSFEEHTGADFVCYRTTKRPNRVCPHRVLDSFYQYIQFGALSLDLYRLLEDYGLGRRASDIRNGLQAMTRDHNNRFLVVYSSQTGQAQAIAEEVAEKALEHGLEANLHCISTTEKKFWLERETCLVFITSTTGDGEPPETASKFWRRLKKKTLASDHLKQLNYALLGLGDSNYTNFCRCGKQFDKRFEELGAKRFYPSQFADDATGLEITVEPWMDGLYPALKAHLDLTSGEQVHNYSAAANDLPDCNEEVNLPTDPTPNSRITEGRDFVDSAQTVKETQISESTVLPKNSNNEQTPVPSHSDTPVIENLERQTSSVKTKPPTSNNSTDQSPALTAEHLNTSTADEIQQEVDSLTHSLPPLSESSLNLPALPPAYLQIKFDSSINVDSTSHPLQNNHPFPSAKSSVQNVPLVAAQVMSRADAVKKALKISVDISNTDWTYEPGDSFGIICPNNEQEVEQLINRLGVSGDADTPCSLSVIEGTKKRNAAVPPHLPPEGSIRQWFTTCCDIRAVPKKPLVRAFVEHTSDGRQKRLLQELCSRQGAERFNKLVREARVGVLDLLLTFPSCAPPLTLLLEHLPRLDARPYSAASCQGTSQNCLDFVFNVVEIPAESGRQSDRQGVCTGWLDRLTGNVQIPYRSGAQNDVTETRNDEILEQMEKLDLEPSKIQIPVFPRSNQYFHPPTDVATPIILIGPGTGVAPYIGFLQQREQYLTNNKEGSTLGESWLFFGCRHQDRDFLFRRELEQFAESGVLSELKVCFSRDSPDGSSVRYVQDNLRLHGHHLCDMVMDKRAHVYVCGDAKNMAKDVRKVFMELLQKYREMSAKEAESQIVDMVINKTYHEDVWA